MCDVVSGTLRPGRVRLARVVIASVHTLRGVQMCIQRGALLLEYQSGRHSLSEGSPWYLEEDVIVKGGCSCRAFMLIRRIFVHLAFQKDEPSDVVDGH
mmetsp:Transcript_18859/g.52270  ORF Transcript_18859/g.52270 Transcript_18859/m.52270 type:complete len:98 (-) Transcript_18859:58-351(-)